MFRYSLTAASLLAACPAMAGDLPGTFNFRDVTASRILATVTEATNNEKEVEFGDFDNDSDLDVVIAVAYADFGQRRNKLYRNDAGTFNEISDTVPLFTLNQGDVARNAFFRDYNQDGWLDIIIVCDNNTGGDPGRTKLWINQHTKDTHTGWVEEGSLRLGPSTGGAACAGVSIDPDGDGDFDLYVGNYPGPSQDTMYFNNGGTGFFDAVTLTNVPTDSNYTVDVASGDINGDGKLDLLVSNHSPNYIYYNDNQGAGSALGDYSYAGSQQNLGVAALGENAMEAGDFDGDGDRDIYWTNRAGSGGDRILRNDGNDVNNIATFTTLDMLPASVTTQISRKTTVTDFDADGRLDLVVMKEVGAGNSRPTILRNTTVHGEMSFIDWTPAIPFPSDQTHKGWHAAAFDADGDGRTDVFIGGWAGDHLMLQGAPTPLDEDDVGGVLDVFNDSPVAVGGHAPLGGADTYTINGLTAGAFVSVVLTGTDDYLLEVLDAADGVLATVDRGGAGVEEAIQYDPASMPSTIKLRVTALACASVHDLDGDCQTSTSDLLVLLGAWGPNPGHAADFDGDDVVGTSDLLELLADWGPSTYVLEVLARDG